MQCLMLADDNLMEWGIILASFCRHPRVGGDLALLPEGEGLLGVITTTPVYYKYRQRNG